MPLSSHYQLTVTNKMSILPTITDLRAGVVVASDIVWDLSLCMFPHCKSEKSLKPRQSYSTDNRFPSVLCPCKLMPPGESDRNARFFFVLSTMPTLWLWHLTFWTRIQSRRMLCGRIYRHTDGWPVLLNSRYAHRPQKGLKLCECGKKAVIKSLRPAWSTTRGPVRPRATWGTVTWKGQRCKLPQLGQGQSPGRQRFLRFLGSTPERWAQ